MSPILLRLSRLALVLVGGIAVSFGDVASSAHGQGLAPASAPPASPAPSSLPGASSPAPSSSTLDLWGVPPFADAAWISGEEARAGLVCVPTCPSGLRVTPVPARPSFAFDDQGRLNVATLQTVATPETFEAGAQVFHALESWVSSVVRIEPQRRPLGARFDKAGSDERLAEIRSGRALVESQWDTHDGLLRLQWTGTRPLALELRIDPRVCDAESRAALAFSLFPPASESQRASAAARLAACKETRATGALVTQLRSDRDPYVRKTALRGLGALPGATPRAAVEAEAMSAYADGGLRAEAVHVLGEASAWPSLQRLALTPNAPDEAVADAVQMLEHSPVPLDAEALARLRVLGGRATRRALAALEVERAQPHELPTPAPAAPADAATPVAIGPTPSGREPGATTAPAHAPPPGRTVAPRHNPGAGTLVRPQAQSPSAEAADAEEPSEEPSEEAPEELPGKLPGVQLPPVELVPPRPAGPRDGAPLAIGAATVGGAALMRNLSLLGLDNASAQVLLGSAGAVIGFGTAWGLARFGLRPTLEQAAWFTNVSTWGALAGLTTYAALGEEDKKLRYGSLVLGELGGMIAGAATAKAYSWTGPQIVFADSLVLASGLGMAGIGRWRGGPSSYTPVAVATVPVMTGAALFAHNLTLSDADVRLMVMSAFAGSWTGGLIGAGAEGSSLFESRQGQGGLLTGAAGGYLAAALAAPFVDLSSDRLSWATTGLLLGNMLGGGAAHLGVGLARDHGDGVLSDKDQERWKLGAGIGGPVMALAAGALGPHLHPGEGAAGLVTEGLVLGLGTPLFASWASFGSQRTAAQEAVGTGSLWVGGTVGGLAGLVASRWWHPDLGDDTTTLMAAAFGSSAGLGLARSLSPHAAPGMPDSLGVYAGAAAGLLGGGLFVHRTELRAPDVGALFAGASWGLALGRLAPSLRLRQFQNDRATSGGTWLGMGLGGLASAALAHGTSARGGQVAVPTFAAAFGTGIGAGAGLLVPGDSSRPVRIGVFAGALSTAAVATAADPWLHLSQGLGHAAPSLGLSLGLLGTGYGTLLAGGLDSSGLVSETPARQRAGGALLGATAGLGAGLVLSTRVTPSGGDQTALLAGSGLGATAAFGLFHMAQANDNATTTWGTMGGAAVGTLGSTLFLQHHSLTSVGAGAGVLGGAWGFLGGRLAPAFFAAHDTDRARAGGSSLGITVGALTATALAESLDAQPGDLKLSVQAAGLGLALGGGAGSMVAPGDELLNRPARATALGASVGLVGAGVLFGRRLHLDSEAPSGTFPLALSGAAWGAADGLLLASLVDDHGKEGGPSDVRLRGGALFGASLGLGAGWIAGHITEVPGPVVASTWVSTGLGGLAGYGSARLLTPAGSPRGEALGALSGSLVGTTAALVAGHYHTPDGRDVPAASLGLALGGLTGWVAPSLGRSTWRGTARDSTGGLALGTSLGVFAGVAAQRTADLPNRTLGLITLGAADGLVTGLGAGLAVSSDPTQEGASSRPARVGLLTGALGGALLGGVVGPRLAWQDSAQPEVVAATALGGWTGYWASALGHAREDDAPGVRRMGITLASAGGASLAALYATAKLDIDPDLVTDALVMDAELSLAGGGLAAVVSSRFDAIPTGIVVGGAGGLLLGGLLHQRLAWQDDMLPNVALGSLLGAWGGGLLPYLIKDEDAIRDRENAGGVLGGMAMGCAISTLFSLEGRLSTNQAATLLDASAAGAALGGGLGFLADDLSLRSRAALAGGGTAVGLAYGALVLPHVIPEKVALGSTLGLTLGTSEALLFAWSSHPDDNGNHHYGGAALLGAGLGTGLGLAGATWLHEGFASVAPAAAGFGAWGGWMGSFGSAFLDRDRASVTTGGIIGTDLGFAAGYALVRSGVVDSSDFGWLSLFSAAGTVLGAGAGAPFSTSTNPRPVLAGLAVGPLVGMGVGAWALPRLRLIGKRAGHEQADEGEKDGNEANDDGNGNATRAAARSSNGRASRDMRLAAEQARGDGSSFERRLNAVIEVTDWSPLVGAMPTPSESVAPSPFLFGVVGHLR